MKTISNFLKKNFKTKEPRKTEYSPFSIEKTNKLIKTINRLLNQPEDELTSTELDYYFETPTSKNPDSAKTIRSRKINELNEYFKLKFGGHLITKRKEKEDQTFSVYIINKKFLMKDSISKMKREIHYQILRRNPDAILFKGLDDCIIGMNNQNLVMYDYNKIVTHLCNIGMDREKAIYLIENKVKNISLVKLLK